MMPQVHLGRHLGKTVLECHSYDGEVTSSDVLSHLVATDA